MNYKFEKHDYGGVPSYKGIRNICIKSDWSENEEPVVNDTQLHPGIKSINHTNFRLVFQEREVLLWVFPL